MASKYTFPHLSISGGLEKSEFVARSPCGGSKKEPRDRTNHGLYLRSQLASASADFAQNRPTDPRVDQTPGIYLEVELKPHANIGDLEKKQSGLKPASAKEAQEGGTRQIALFMPEKAQVYFDNALTKYQTGDLKGEDQKPPLQSLMEPIESMKSASLETLWTDNPAQLPPNPSDTIWWEVWCIRKHEQVLLENAEKLGARCASEERRLYFPEQVVIPILTTREKIEVLIFADFSIVEVRNATDNPTSVSVIGTLKLASLQDVDRAFSNARCWNVGNQARADILNKAADLYEADFGAVFSLLAAEEGKTLPDAVAELREAVDFLRYYAAQALGLENRARGTFACISPWNFPLAIFTGQISAALAAGNAVLAKPAETTPAIASWAVTHLHEAGVLVTALQFLPGKGRSVGVALTSDPRVAGVAFTGSTQTARHIQRAMSRSCKPGTPLIAETGGLNAMIVDSTALPEQAVRDILASAFQSAGQRCSALRCLYVQEDIAPNFLNMLKGAIDQLSLGDPWNLSTDIGPVITPEARDQIETYVQEAHRDGRVIHQIEAPKHGTFVAPALLSVNSICDLQEEVFGPILHVATFRADQLDQVVQDINTTGYGLTFGIHTRIESRIQKLNNQIAAGNIYANRNQIGAVVGSQPFGGEGMSGTGPKAGGPLYLARFTCAKALSEDFESGVSANFENICHDIEHADAGDRLTSILPGPTGELNLYTTYSRHPILCLGPGEDMVRQQINAIQDLGGVGVAVSGQLPPQWLIDLPAFGGVMWWGKEHKARTYEKALAARPGPIIPLITDFPDVGHALRERHLCIDTTASGGNVTLLSAV